MRKDVQDKISMLIEKYKDNNIVRELKMSDKEIFDNISNILMYININNACEKSNSNECVNQEHLHVEIFRNKNGDIQCNYFQCPKHLKQLEIQNMSERKQRKIGEEVKTTAIGNFEGSVRKIKEITDLEDSGPKREQNERQDI